MAIVKMNKFTLLVFEENKRRILEELQMLEAVEFINLQAEELLEENEQIRDLEKDRITSEYNKCEENLTKLKFCLEFLNNYIPRKPALKALKKGKTEITREELGKLVEDEEWKKLYKELKNHEQRITSIDSEILKIKSDIDAVEPWIDLDAPFKELKDTRCSSILIGSVPRETESRMIEASEKELENAYFEIISRDSKSSYILAVCHLDYKDRLMELLKTHGFNQVILNYVDTASETVETLREQIADLEKEKTVIFERLKNFDSQLLLLEMTFDYYSNMFIRLEAPKYFLKTKNITVIVGWSAAQDNEKLEKIIRNAVDEDYYLSFEEVHEKDLEKVPIKLRNNDFASSFEPITEMYSMPKYDEIDPTPLLAPFYFIFFGMMVGDIGYGLVVFIASILALKLLKLDVKQQKMGKFFFYLSISTMIFGAVFGSFFGDAIKIPGLFNQTRDIMTIMIISMGMGVIHIFFGLSIKAYMLIRNGDVLGAFYDVGSWVITLIGTGFFLGGGALGLTPEVKNIFKYMMIAGALLIVATQGRQVKKPAARVGAGLYALYGISSYVGDLVSYTRLMALGLAGGQLANSFNLIVRMMPGVVGAFIIGPVFFVFFHIFNLLLSLLGAYVHTCRLQYVEFFTKFYEGGGKAFKPFGNLNMYLEIKRD